MYEGGKCIQAPGKAMLHVSLAETFERQEQQLEAQLKDVKRVRQLLKDNTTLAEFHELMLRCR